MTISDLFKDKEEADIWLKRKMGQTVIDGDCLLFTGGLGKWGYGKCKIKKKSHGLHRIVKLIALGELPEGCVVMHKCDTPSCIKEDHLEVGSVLDNNRDIIAKRRAFWQKNYTEACVKSEKHSISQVLKSIRVYLEKNSVAEASKAHGVPEGSLSAYIRTALGKVERVKRIKEVTARIPKAKRAVDADLVDLATSMSRRGSNIDEIAAQTGIYKGRLNKILIDLGCKPVRKVKYSVQDDVKLAIHNRITAGERVSVIARAVGLPYGTVYKIKNEMETP